MKRLMTLVLGGLLVSSSAFAQATATPPAKSTAKTMTAAGSVTAVAADSLTVKVKSGDMTFAVDKETRVRVAGATRKTAELKDSKTPPAITEYVKVGDSVTVKYHDGATKHAADVLVRSSIKK